MLVIELAKLIQQRFLPRVIFRIYILPSRGHLYKSSPVEVSVYNHCYSPNTLCITNMLMHFPLCKADVMKVLKPALFRIELSGKWSSTSLSLLVHCYISSHMTTTCTSLE